MGFLFCDFFWIGIAGGITECLFVNLRLAVTISVITATSGQADIIAEGCTTSNCVPLS
jgi:hypothetical protein